MRKNNSIVVGMGAMLALAVSLPLEWITVNNAKMQFSVGLKGLSDMMSSSFGTMTMKITGINGHITFLAKLPIWLIILIGFAGVLLAFLNSLRITSFPKPVPLIPLSLSALYVIIAFAGTIVSPDATVEVGIFTALVGLLLGYIHALA